MCDSIIIIVLCGNMCGSISHNNSPIKTLNAIKYYNTGSHYDLTTFSSCTIILYPRRHQCSYVLNYLMLRN